jgi:cytochrome c biogenesis protein CcmG/thiol:disulfide interchange protein DsbE
MTLFAKVPRLAAVTLAAMLAVAACGGSEAADSVSDAATESAESQDEVASESEAAAPAALQVSPSLDIVGDALVPFEDPSNDPAVGVIAPVITGKSFDGSDITIGGETDGPTMLVFLAHWCPHCNDEIPEIVKLRDAGSLPENLNIVGISTAVADDRDNFPPSRWIIDKDWTWPVLADTAESEAFQAYGGTGFPYTVMLQSDGSVAARKSGSASAEQILDWIESSLLV